MKEERVRKVPLTYANEDDKKNGWVLSYKFLEEVQLSLEEKYISDEIPQLEQIEDVILAYEKLK
jgi:hypothetical protein